MYGNIKVMTRLPGTSRPTPIQRWHPMRTAMMMRLAPVMGRRALAEYLGISLRSLRQKAERMNITLRSDRPAHYTAAELRFMRENRDTLSYEEIAAVLGRPVGGLRVAMNARGWRRGAVRGESHPSCKYPDSDVQLAWALKEEGVMVKDIAEKLEVPLPTVRSWIYAGGRASTEALT